MSNKIARKYLPRFEGPIEGYVTNFLRQHHWKVASSMETDDAIQEARLVFLRCASKYGITDTPQHFMALFKTAWTRHFLDLARLDSDAREVITYGHEAAVREDEDPLNLLDLVPGDLDTAGYLNTLLREAPRDIITILSFFLSSPPALARAAGEAWSGAGRKQQDGNRMLCEVLGFPRGTDVLGKVEAYLKT
ncbi:MAG: hypothetical protein E6Q97_22545 [Desulfurellales bacterium]|nr:MAG: hypothetical protein E6Q97_22545 [Desulfurellales bacterium]